MKFVKWEKAEKNPDLLFIEPWTVAKTLMLVWRCHQHLFVFLGH